MVVFSIFRDAPTVVGTLIGAALPLLLLFGHKTCTLPLKVLLIKEFRGLKTPTTVKEPLSR